MPKKRIYNFSAGPATLPDEVIEQAQKDIWNIRDSGIGILEHSHRGKVFEDIIRETEHDCRQLANISDDYEVLFLQGGATLQFAMIPQAFLGAGKHLDVLNTGIWTENAIKDAKRFGDIHYAYDGKDSQFDHIPQDSEINYSKDPTYVHYCSNNTIYGTEWKRVPKTEHPLVCDMSSNILSKPIDIDKHALIFAGTQKNLGPAGCCLVIANKEFLAKNQREGLPFLLDYKHMAAKRSMHNTPPTFTIYIIGRVFKWLLAQGGLEAIEQHNIAKAKVLFDAIEKDKDFYTAFGREDSRSVMNVAFRTPNAELDKKFIDEAFQAGFSGLKGHRALGGLRASIYNAFPAEGSKALAKFMTEFAQTNR